MQATIRFVRSEYRQRARQRDVNSTKMIPFSYRSKSILEKGEQQGAIFVCGGGGGGIRSRYKKSEQDDERQQNPVHDRIGTYTGMHDIKGNRA